MPTPMIQGAEDACDPPSESENDGASFDGPYERLLLPGVGHVPGREAPLAFAEAFLRFRERYVRVSAP